MLTPCTLSASTSNCAPERGAGAPWGCDRGGGQAADAISPLPCCGGFRGCAPLRAIVDSVIFIVITKIREAFAVKLFVLAANRKSTTNTRSAVPELDPPCLI